MKFTVFMLSALLLLPYVSAYEKNCTDTEPVPETEQTCQDVDLSILDSFHLLNSASHLGIEWAKWLFQNYGDSSGLNLDVTRVTSICKWQVGNDIYNKFEAEATNADEDATLKTTFTIHCADDDTAPPELIKWKYHVNHEKDSNEDNEGNDGSQHPQTPPDTEENCQDVDISILNSFHLLNSAANLGIEWAKWLFQNYGDSNGLDLDITSVKKICKWQVGNDIYNRFEAEATNDNRDATLKTTFTIHCADDDTAPPVLIKWDYHVEYDTGSNEGDQESGDNGSHETEETCQDVDITILDSFHLLNSAANLGIEWAKWLFQNYGDSNGLDLDVTRVKSICKWQLGNDIYNKFEAEATNDNEDAILKTTFTVHCADDDTAPPVLIKWKYHVHYRND